MITTLNELLAEVGNPPFDLLLIGDGSGQGWDRSMGWSVVSIDRQSGKRELIVGGASFGTVNLAEIQPFIHALSKDFCELQNHRLRHPRKVVIFSDSEVTVRTGNKEYSSATNNPHMWLCLEFFRQQGYEVTFFYRPRNQNPMHVAIDAASKEGKSLGVGLDWLIADLYNLLPYHSPYAQAPAEAVREVGPFSRS